MPVRLNGWQMDAAEAVRENPGEGLCNLYLFQVHFGTCSQNVICCIWIQAPLPSRPGEDAFTLSTGEKLFVQEADTAQSMLAGIALELIDNDGLKNKEPETLILASRIYRMIGDLYLRLESQQEAEIANGYATLFEKQASKLTGGDLTCGEY